MSLKKFLYIIILSILIFHLNCTNNPFGNDEISDKGRKITGTVKLTDYSSPQGIYVWLEAIEVGTYTDENGFFELMLPSSGSQPGGGVSGAFDLFFYVANYGIKTASVVLRKGIIQLGQGDINEDGEVNTIQQLSKILNITMVTTPDSYPIHSDVSSVIQEQCYGFTGYEKPLSVEVVLSAISSSVDIKIPNSTQGPTGIIYFKKLNSEQEFVRTLPSVSMNQQVNLTTVTVKNDSKIYSTGFQLDPNYLPKGDYRIFPFLFIQQDGLPQELINTIMDDATKINAEYTNIPLKYSGGNLSILD